MDQNLREEAIRSDFSKDGDWNSSKYTNNGSETNSSNDFECNICLDFVQDPVVTLYGHLYCWSCIYRWIIFHDTSHICPVCKSEVSLETLIPLYGRGENASKNKSSRLLIPQRPVQRLLEPSYVEPSRAYRTGNYMDYPVIGLGGRSSMHLVDPIIGMFEEMVYTRVFGNSDTSLFTYRNSYQLGDNSSPRLRRHMMENDKSLSRICCFLFCCVISCLILF